MEGVENKAKKIIFLEDGSLTARRLRRAIENVGHAYLHANSEETLREHLATGADIVLHIPSEPKRQFGLLKTIATEKPYLPVLHIIEEALFSPTDCLKSPLHEWMSITAPVESVLWRIETLTQFAGLKHDLAAEVDLNLRTAEFTRAIRGVDTGAVLRQGMTCLQREFGSANVIWFPEGALRAEFDRYMSSRNVIPLTKQPTTRQTWTALNPLKAADLEALFEKWCLLIASTASLETQVLTMGGSKDFIVPVRTIDPKEGAFAGRLYGHLIFVEPGNSSLLLKTRVFDAYIDLLAQQLAETQAYARLQAMTYKDDLTDLYNQRYLPVILEQELNRASRHDKEFSVLFLDVDFFKLVNDTKGHMVGSRVLVELSKLFKGSIRSTDFAFRYGGDEYVIILSGASSKNAMLVAERLRQRTEGTTFSINETQVKITVSIGIATFPEHAKSTDDLLQMADEAMYYGKNKSRNIVYMAS